MNVQAVLPAEVLVALRHMLARTLMEHELRLLCDALGRDAEELAGARKSERLRDLLEQCVRHGQLAALVAALGPLRPLAARPGTPLGVEWETLLARVAPLLALPVPRWQPPPCPYPGLAAFGADGAHPFFGREAELQQIRFHLARRPLLLLIGSSGSGKSSLVHAGVLPTLAPTACHTMRPGTEPLAALEAALGALPTQGARLLVIDQLEECFALPRAASDAFLAALHLLAQAGEPSLLLLLRSDFYGSLLDSPLWGAAASHLFPLEPLRAAALREAIVRPAELRGVEIEPRLLDRLLAEGGDQPGQLPFLQQTLKLLWEETLRFRQLTLEGYERLLPEADPALPPRSGLERALAAHAEQALAALGTALADAGLPLPNPADREALARRLFVRLVHFGTGRPATRRQQPESALLDVDSNPARSRVALAHFAGADQRLLVLSGDAREVLVDLAHEALIAGWPRLRRWMEDSQQRERERRQWDEAVALWQRHGERGGLLDRAPLDKAARWLAAAPAEEHPALRRLVQASRRALWRQWASVAGLALLALALLLALWGWPLWRAEQSRRAVIAASPMTLIAQGEGSDEPMAPPFQLEQYEVRNRHYCACVQAGHCEEPENQPGGRTVCAPADAALPAFPDLPVTALGRSKAEQYCAWITRRLPTADEWERAARGAEGRRYASGQEAPEAGAVNLRGSGGRCEEPSLWPVAQQRQDLTLSASGEILFVGLEGNVSEWVTKGPVPFTVKGGNYCTLPVEVALWLEADSAGSPNYGVRCAADLP